MSAPLAVLHAATECFPLIKTGGLGDVVGALPAAQRALGVDARVFMPAYRGMADKLGNVRALRDLRLRGHDFRLLRGETAQAVPILLLDCPALFDRPGAPYSDADGQPFADELIRFGLFSEAAARLAAGEFGLPSFDVLHLHDWHSALAAGWRRSIGQGAVVFTIHNLAYQGDFPRAHFAPLQLPDAWWNPEGIEVYGRGSCIKAGLNFSDAITTVSPTYASEIQTPEQGHGLDGLLRAKAAKLHGILNGVDTEAWNPATDTALVQPYDLEGVARGKRANRRALKMELGLPVDERPLAIFIGRLVQQKGVDALLAARAAIDTMPLQLAILAGGDRPLEAALAAWAAARPDQVAVRLRQDEALAHRMTAAADLQLMPSRFEPCGLSQMYAQRYGTLPVVHRTGGLQDTVVDATPAAIADGTATGVWFEDVDAGGVSYGLRRGLELLADAAVHARLRRAGMRRDFSWAPPAREYLRLYAELAGTKLVPERTPPTRVDTWLGAQTSRRA